MEQQADQQLHLGQAKQTLAALTSGTDGVFRKVDEVSEEVGSIVASTASKNDQGFYGGLIIAFTLALGAGLFAGAALARTSSQPSGKKDKEDK